MESFQNLLNKFTLAFVKSLENDSINNKNLHNNPTDQYNTNVLNGTRKQKEIKCLKNKIS